MSARRDRAGSRTCCLIRSLHALKTRTCGAAPPSTAWGPSDFDARNRFTAAYEYALPFGRGKPLAGGVSGAADKFLSGWGLRGLTFFQTGLPQSPMMAVSRVGHCVAACTARPDRIVD